MKVRFFILLFPLTLSTFLSCKKSRDEPEPTQGDLEGRVYSLDSDDNIRVVANAEIDINNSALKTNELGEFSIENLNQGSYDVIVSHPKHDTKTETLDIIAGETVAADIILTPLPSILLIDSEDFSDSLTLDFDSTKTELIFSIKNGGGEDLVWRIDESSPWLSVNDLSGTNESIIKVTIDRNELDSFEDSTSIIITNTSTNNELIIKAKVKINIENQLKKGLLAYYPFNGNANDESGNEYHGMNEGAELTTDRHGNINSAYYFDGTDVISVPNHSSINFLNEFSITCWINSESTKSPMSIIIKNGLYTDFYLFIMSNITYFKFRNSENIDYQQSSNKKLDMGKWHSLIFTRNKSNSQKIFLDGVLISEKIESNQIEWLSKEISIGGFLFQHNLGNYYHGFVGKIDDVRIYNRVLFEEEIKYLSEH